MCRPLIQGKLDVLSQAGLSKDDFSKADSTFMKDPSQLSLFECFSELISDKELANMASFDEEEDKLVASSGSQGSSSSEDHKDNFGSSIMKSQAHTTKSMASELTMDDDDPDFRVSRQASRTVHSAGTDNTKLIQRVKATSQTSEKVIHTQFGRGNRDKLEQNVKHKTSTNASRLANYLLQHVDSAGPVEESNHRKDQLEEDTHIERDTYEENIKGECKLGDGVEWFGLNSEENLDNFEHFDDDADFLSDI